MSDSGLFSFFSPVVTLSVTSEERANDFPTKISRCRDLCFSGPFSMSFIGSKNVESAPSPRIRVLFSLVHPNLVPRSELEFSRVAPRRRNSRPVRQIRDEVAGERLSISNFSVPRSWLHTRLDSYAKWRMRFTIDVQRKLNIHSALC